MITIDHDVAVLDGRVLHVRDLERGSTSFTVRYRLTPALDEPADVPFTALALEAEDDQGGEYLDGGGARGPSEDGAATVGSITGQPAIADGAERVTLRFRFMTVTDEWEYTLEVELS